MNYRKIVEKALNHQKDHSLTAFALLTGLAVGATLAALFAPRSGRESRKMLRECLLHDETQHQHELEEALFEDLRETTRDHADQLQGPANKRKDPSQIKVPSAGTTAWKKQQEA